MSFKNADHRSTLFNDAPMPNSVFFNGGIAFHQGSLTALSHGCLHLSGPASKKFLGALAVGETVQVVAVIGGREHPGQPLDDPVRGGDAGDLCSSNAARTYPG